MDRLLGMPVPQHRCGKLDRCGADVEAAGIRRELLLLVEIPVPRDCPSFYILEFVMSRYHQDQPFVMSRHYT